MERRNSSTRWHGPFTVNSYPELTSEAPFRSFRPRSFLPRLIFRLRCRYGRNCDADMLSILRPLCWKIEGHLAKHLNHVIKVKMPGCSGVPYLSTIRLWPTEIRTVKSIKVVCAFVLKPGYQRNRMLYARRQRYLPGHMLAHNESAHVL